MKNVMNFALLNLFSAPLLLAICLSSVLAAHVFAQSEADRSAADAKRRLEPDIARFPHEVIVPNVPMRFSACKVQSVSADVTLKGNVAQTTLNVTVFNPGNRPVEAELLLPIPDGAAVKAFDFKGKAAESKARLLPKEEAWKQYREIVAKMRDPAIMEFAGCNMIRTAVFPVEPHQTQVVQLSYEEMLKFSGNRLDYVLLRSEAPDFNVPWSIRIRGDFASSEVYSPTHAFNRGELDKLPCITVDSAQMKEPGPFMLSAAPREKGPIAYLYPDPRVNGGYFMVVGTPAAKCMRDSRVQSPAPSLARNVIFTIDRSGSMSSGEKWNQAREAVKQVVSALADSDYFNVVVYNHSVDVYSLVPIRCSAESRKALFAYLDGLSPMGATNLNDAVIESLRLSPADGNCVNSVLFLTDGQPTVGQVHESAICETVRKACAGKNPPVRIYTFGVGTDVNAPLLDRIAADARGRSTYVLAKENIEAKVWGVSKYLGGPAYSKVCYACDSAFSDFTPVRPDDVYSGESVITLGRYTDVTLKNESATDESRRANTLRFGLQETGAAEPFFTVNLDPRLASTANAFVPRLFAARRVAELQETLRLIGDGKPVNPDDAKCRELINEIVRLSLEYGILTPYTAYFSTEGSLSGDAANISSETAYSAPAVSAKKLAEGYAFDTAGRMQQIRAGKDAVIYSINVTQMKTQARLNQSNAAVQADSDEQVMRVRNNGMMQMNRQAFVKMENVWTEGAALNAFADQSRIQPKKTVEFGSAEYDEVARRLILSQRQNVLGQRGDFLVLVDGEPVLIRNTPQTR